MSYIIFTVVVAFGAGIGFGMGWEQSFSLAWAIFAAIILGAIFLHKLFGFIYYLCTGESPPDNPDDTQ